MVAAKELDEKLRALQEKLAEEELDWKEEQRKLFEFEEKYLRDTIVEGNMLVGWGDSKSAPIRFRNATLRKKKRDRQEAASNFAVDLTPTMTAEEQLKIDLHRLASYSSVTSPAEPLLANLRERENQMALSKAKKVKK
jgi:5'-3' exonuclease|uniref:Chromatin modification-related protein MEAF6 n=1 Tax=Globisporangium ultimum (strain ATCC 200006 / CBS 805.95 / DAOM BR144) TaxID=431595 RepID=K3WMJ7_GLOUD